MTRHLITSAIPYINGIKHLGNLVGSQLPADLYARYLRARGHEVMFICATDEHGTPAELAAKKAGQPVAVYCAEMHKTQADIAARFGLSFDHFGRSSSERNHLLTQHFAGKLAEAGLIREVSERQVYSNADRRFLPDRYIEGTCPNCGYDKARGDQCENCRFGPGGEGIVSVGPGTLSLTETHYERVSERKPLADGWYRATWACMSEGTECGRSVIDLRITPRRIDVRLDGTTLSAQRCPG